MRVVGDLLHNPMETPWMSSASRIVRVGLSADKMEGMAGSLWLFSFGWGVSHGKRDLRGEHQYRMAHSKEDEGSYSSSRRFASYFEIDVIDIAMFVRKFRSKRQCRYVSHHASALSREVFINLSCFHILAWKNHCAMR